MTKVPKSKYQSRSLFPVGRFSGKIAESKKEDNRDGTIVQAFFQMVDNEAVEAEIEPGARKLFVRIPIAVEVEGKRGKKEWLSVAQVADDEDVYQDENTPFMLKRAVGQFAQLAAALREASVDESGEIGDFDMEEFVDKFTDAQFDDEIVEFRVFHRHERDAETRKPTGRSFEGVDFLFEKADEEEEEAKPATRGRSRPAKEEEEDEEETEEVPEEDEEEEEPAPRRSAARAVASAKSKASKTTKKGSGKGRFVRKR